MAFSDLFNEVYVLLRLLGIVWILTVVILLLTAADAVVPFRFVSFVFIKTILLTSGLLLT